MATALNEARPIRGMQGIAERPDGERRWFEPYPTPLFDAAGRLSGGINMMLDITERKRAEEALQESDRRKDEFLALLAHELRNPLAPIRTGLELIRLSGDTPQSVRRVRSMMERQIRQMVRLIDDLLDVSRIASGKIVLQRAPSSLADLVQNAIEAHRTAIEAAKIRSDRRPANAAMRDRCGSDALRAGAVERAAQCLEVYACTRRDPHLRRHSWCR